jgi:hypothetical protein
MEKNTNVAYIHHHCYSTISSLHNYASHFQITTTVIPVYTNIKIIFGTTSVLVRLFKISFLPYLLSCVFGFGVGALL